MTESTEMFYSDGKNLVSSREGEGRNEGGNGESAEKEVGKLHFHEEKKTWVINMPKTFSS